MLSQVEEALNEVKLVSFKHASRNRASNQNDAIVDCPRPPLVKAVKETPQVLNSRGCVILFAGLISSGSLERSSERVSRAPAYQRTEKGVSQCQRSSALAFHENIDNR